MEITWKRQDQEIVKNIIITRDGDTADHYGCLMYQHKTAFSSELNRFKL